MASLVLKTIFEEDWAWEMQDNPEFASQAGAHDTKWAPENALQHVGPSSYQARAAHSQSILDKLEKVLSEAKEGELSKQEKIFAALIKSQHLDIVESVSKCPLYLLPINSIGAGGISFSFLEAIEWLRLESSADLEVLLSRLKCLPQQMNEYIECLKAGLEAGYVASQAMMRTAASTLEKLSTEQGLFPELEAAEKLAASLPEGPVTPQVLLDATTVCRQAFGTMLQFLRDSYIPALRTNPACSSLPCGPDGYAKCLQFHTTTSLSPEQIHALGLAEVERIEQRYRTDVLAPLGYGPQDFAKFVAHARSDPQFYATSSEQLLEHYRATCAHIATLLPTYFAEFPRSQLEIVSADKGPTAFYIAGTADGQRPGKFYVNTSNLKGKPVYEAMALALHEAIPGHHHQVSLALENESVPKVLRHTEDRRYEACPCRRQLYSAFCEGWALYCEALGEEMGLYPTPHHLFGRLSMDMMRAVRLVVDTGLHHFRWTIEHAVQYFQEKTGMHTREVENEVYRYASWPGQACAYKIGQLEILRLRKLAEEALGSKFSLKAFHTLCLTSGPLTLSLLASMVEEHIAASV